LDASFTLKRAKDAPRKRRVLAQNVTWEVTNVVDSLARNTVYMKCIVFVLTSGTVRKSRRRSPGGLPQIERVPQAD